VVHQRPHEAGHPRPSVGIIGYKPCFSMNFWSAAAAGTISLSEKCSDDGRRDDMGLAGMRRLLPKLISLLFFFWEFSANEVELYRKQAEKRQKRTGSTHMSNRLVTHLCYLHVPVRDGGETHLLIGFFKPMGGG